MSDLKPCPDSAGFWWYQSAKRPGWEMVEAREVYPGHICLYSCTLEWGGYNLETAGEHLPGKWVKVEQPTSPQMLDDSRMLDWLLKLIEDKGTDGLLDFPWSVLRDEENDEDEDDPERLSPILDRAAIRAAMK